MALLDIAYISKRISYDPCTGHFTWKPIAASSQYELAWNSRWAGKQAGGVRGNGYAYISMGGTHHLCHRLAWAIYFGSEPNGQLDHINGDPTDNRISNLREATQSQNCANQGSRKSNTSGYRGVTWNRRRNKWQAQIQVNKKHRVLGHFNDAADAAKAYQAAATAGFGQFYRVVKP